MKSLYLLLALSLSLQAENRIFNGSFELGTEGFVLERLLRPDANPDLTFTESEPAKGASGGTALRISNPFSESTTLHVREISVPRGTRQTFRFRAKAERTMNLRVHARIQYEKGSPTYSKTFRLTPEWSDFEYTFPVRQNENGYCTIRLQNDCNPATFYLDRMSLSTEKESDGPAAPELAFRTDRSFYYKGDTANITVMLHNPGKQNFDAQVRIKLVDDYSGAETSAATLPVSVKPGAVFRHSFKLPLSRYGGFSLTAAAPRLRTSPGSLVVIGRYERKPLDVRKTFCLGFNGGASYQWRKDDPRHTGYLSFGISPDRKFAELAAMGTRLLRSHDDGSNLANWAAFETESGEFRQDRLKRELALFRKHGITPLPVLLNTDFPVRTQPWMRETFPDYVIRQSEVVTASHNKTIRINLPPDELFRRYVRAFVSAGGADFPVIEIFNEAQFHLTPQQYMRYLKIASGEIRALRPETKIIGFCTTSDKGESIGPFLHECLRLGGAAMTDAVSFHPYQSRRLGSATPADQQIAALRKLLSSCPHLTMWNTELYYLHDEPGGFRWPTSAHHIATRLMLDLGEGVESSMPITLNRIRKPSFSPHYQGDGPFVWQWSANFAACNAFARFLEGAKPLAKFRNADAGVIFYVYEKNGAPVAAVWNYLEKEEVYGEFGAFLVRDLFGNTVNGRDLHLKQAPFYLFPKPGMNREQFLSALKALPVRMDQPLEIAPAARLAGGTLYLRIRNSSSKPLESWIGVSGAVAQKEPLAYSLKSGEIRLIAIPVEQTPETGKPLTVSALVHGRMVKKQTELYRNRLAGSGERWKIGDFAECSVTLEKDNLVFRAEVMDSTPSGNTDRHAPWRQDSIELFWDNAPLDFPVIHPAAYHKGVMRAFLFPHSGTFRLWNWNEQEVPGNGCTLKVRKQDNGYSLCFRIPRTLAGTGNRIGFECKINDSAVPGKILRSANWSGKPNANRNTFLFNMIEKKEEIR